MKIKLQTLLKHKLQWLLLLAALLGVSQGVWGENITIYLYNALNWNTPYIYYWGGSSSPDWPGVAMDLVTGNTGWYFKEIPDNSSSLIFNCGNSSCQTTNTSIDAIRCFETYDDKGIKARAKNCPCSTAGGTANVNNNTTATISRGESVTLSLTGQTAGSTVVWKKSTDGGSSWSNVGGSTDTPDQNTQYRADVTAGGCTVNSTVATAQMPTTIYVDVKSSAGWNSAYLYYWKSSNDNDKNSAWPGTVMTAVSGNDGWYSGEIAAGYDKYIINNGDGGNGNQTVDLNASGGQLCIKVKSASGEKNQIENTDCPAACTAPAYTDFKVDTESADYTGNPLTTTVSSKTQGYSPTNITVGLGSSSASTESSKTAGGIYNVYVLAADASGDYCALESPIATSVGTFTILVNQATLSINNATTTYCQDGEVTLTTSGGTGDGTVTYQIVTGAGAGTGTGSIAGNKLTCSSPGTIVVKATKAASSYYKEATSANKTFTFNEVPTAGSATVNGSTGPITVQVGSDIALALTGDNGSSVQWQSKSGSGAWGTCSECTGGTTRAATVSSLSQGTYYYQAVVTGSNGCTSTTDAVQVNVKYIIKVRKTKMFESTTPYIHAWTEGGSCGTGVDWPGKLMESLDENWWGYSFDCDPGKLVFNSGANQGNQKQTVDIIRANSGMEGPCYEITTEYTDQKQNVATVAGCVVCTHPTISQFNVSGSFEQLLSDGVSAISVASKTPLTYNPTITVKYDGDDDLPNAIGTYPVTIDVTAAGDYCAETGIPVGTLIVGNTMVKVKYENSTIESSWGDPYLYYWQTDGDCDGNWDNSLLMNYDGSEWYTKILPCDGANRVIFRNNAKNAQTDDVTFDPTKCYMIMQATSGGSHNDRNNVTETHCLACENPIIGNSGNVTVSTEGSSGCPGTVTLSITASGGSGTLTYQWYKNAENSASGGVAVSEKLAAAQGGASYKPSAGDAGEYYYYCVVRSEGECEENSATSNVSSKVKMETALALTPLSVTVKSYESVTITATNANVKTWSLSPAEGATRYLYDSSKRRTKFKGVGGSPAVVYTITGTAYDGVLTCPGKVTVTVNADTNPCP